MNDIEDALTKRDVQCRVVNKDLAWALFWIAVIVIAAAIFIAPSVAVVWVAVVIGVGLFSYFIADPLLKRFTKR